MPRGVRTLVVGVPEWPVVAAGARPAEATVVVEGNQVVAVSVAARAEGVRPGLRRREAQARCPEVAVVPADPGRDVREFEPVVAAVSELCPQLETIRPGWCAIPTRGPSRYFGGDTALARRVQAAAQAAVGPRGAVRAGVADGRFAAELAALGAGDGDTPTTHSGCSYAAYNRTATTSSSSGGGAAPVVVPAGDSPAWLAPLPVGLLGRADGAVPADLVDLFSRLGLRTLGALAALPRKEVVARFGPPGVTAHRLASGEDERPFRRAPPPADLAVEETFDPAVERLDTAAFAARSLADELQRRLRERGEACTRLLVVAETEHGERLERRWRHDPSSTARAVADRVRWQLEGWLQGSTAGQARPTAGIARLRLVPDEVVAATGTQLRLWGQGTVAPDRVDRAVARLVGLLGPEAVTVPEWRGGRHAGEQVATVPTAAVDLTGERTGAAPPPATRDPDRPPWPGRLPAPSPTVVFDDTQRPPAEVIDEAGTPVRVDGRALLSAPPAGLRVAGGRRQRITAWAGPWPVVERWWEPTARRRQARFQVVTDDGSAYLLVLEGGRWAVAAAYD